MQLSMPTDDKKFAIIKEIEAQIIQIDILLPKTDNVTKYVELLAKKRVLTELLNQERNGI